MRNPVFDKSTKITSQNLLYNKCVVFVDEIDNSFTELEAVYIEFRDILDLCQIDVNDISRGSDYGD